MGLLLAFANLACASEGPTKADIPAGLAPELKGLIEDTFAPEPKKRAEAAERLGEMGEKAAAAVPFLIRLVHDDATASRETFEGAVKYTVMVSLGKIGSPAVEPTIAALRRSSGQKRVDLILALGDIKDRRVVGAFLSVLDDSDQEVCWRAAEELMFYLEHNPSFRKLPGLTQSLIHATEHKNPEVRGYITKALGKSRDPAAFETLVKLLKDPDDSVRRDAIWALGDLGDPRATDILMHTMRNASDRIHVYEQEGFAATRSLGRLGKSEPTFNLLLATVLSNMPMDIRCGAISGLGEMGDRLAIKYLLDILKNKQREPSEVRACVVEAIAKLQGREAAPLFRQLALDDKEPWRVRLAAAMSLAEVTKYEVDDVGIVKVIADYNGEGDGNSALWNISKHGKTDAVRKAALDGIDPETLKMYRQKELLDRREKSLKEEKKVRR